MAFRFAVERQILLLGRTVVQHLVLEVLISLHDWVVLALIRIADSIDLRLQ